MTRTLESALAATHKSPSKKQVAAGNYRKGKVTLHGLTVSIEHPAGTVRRKGWKPLTHHYGYLLRTEGRDGQHVDCYIGPDPESEIVFIVDQQHESGRFDEHKVLFGFHSKREAKAGYLANYPADWKCGPITAMTVDQLREWLADGDTTRRVEYQVSKYDRSLGGGMPQQGTLHVGMTKNVGGVTYRLNENHRWELADDEDPETAHESASKPQADRAEKAPRADKAERAPKASEKRPGVPSDDSGGQAARQRFAASQLQSVDPGVRGLMAAIQEHPTYKAGGDVATFDVNPKVAAQLYAGLQQHAGKTMGGGQVVDLGEGRVGFASAAGSMVIWPPDEQGRQRVSYTNRTGVVSRAMQGKATDAPTKQQELPTIAKERRDDLAQRLPGVDKPAAGSAPQPGKPDEEPIQAEAVPEHEVTGRTRDEAAGKLHDALDEWEQALESGDLSGEENAWHKARVSALRQKLTHANNEHRRAMQAAKPKAGAAKVSAPHHGKATYLVNGQEYHLSVEEADKMAQLGLKPQLKGSGPQPEAVAEPRVADYLKPENAKKAREAAPPPNTQPTNVGQTVTGQNVSPKSEQKPEASLADRAKSLQGQIDAAKSETKAIEKKLAKEDRAGDLAATAKQPPADPVAAGREIMGKERLISPKDLAKRLGVDVEQAKKIQGDYHAELAAQSQQQREQEARTKARDPATLAANFHKSQSPAWKKEAKESAEFYGVTPEEFTSMAKEFYDNNWSHKELEYEAKRRAHELTGLRPHDVHALENYGLDSAGLSTKMEADAKDKSTRGLSKEEKQRRRQLGTKRAQKSNNFDLASRSLKAEFPHLNWESGLGDIDDGDISGSDKLWELLKAPMPKKPSMLDEDFLQAFHSHLAEQMQANENSGETEEDRRRRREELDAIPFSRAKHGGKNLVRVLPAADSARDR